MPGFVKVTVRRHAAERSGPPVPGHARHSVKHREVAVAAALRARVHGVEVVEALRVRQPEAEFELARDFPQVGQTQGVHEGEPADDLSAALDDVVAYDELRERQLNLAEEALWILHLLAPQAQDCPLVEMVAADPQSR